MNLLFRRIGATVVGAILLTGFALSAVGSTPARPAAATSGDALAVSTQDSVSGQRVVLPGGIRWGSG